MQGIGPGSILGGRYVVEHRAAHGRGVEHWSARDSTLDRAVTLLVMSREHPNLDAVLDAARRVAGLDNARLVRILDVAADADLGYVVEESLEGSHTLAELLEDGPLPAAEVRRIVGETSVVLDVARHRGLHHQQLNPGVVLRTPDGDIKVRGLATLAALAGIDHITDQAAARSDAIAAVGLAYAGLTGHWPLPGDSGGLPPAPEVAGRVAAPTDIGGGVPADLDALCRLTFANDQGPTTPGDFARQIAPWSPIPVLLTAIPRAQVPRPPAQQRLADVGSPDAPATTSGSTDAPEPSAAESPVLVAHRVPAATQMPTTDSEIDSPSDDADPDGPTVTDDDATSDVGDDDVVGEASSASDDGEPNGDTTGEDPTESAPATTVPPTITSPVAKPVDATSAPVGPSPLATLGSKTAAALGAAGAATAEAAKSATARIGDWSSQARDKARTAVETHKAQREAAALARAEQAPSTPKPPRQAPSDDPARATPIVRSRGAGGLEPPVPLLPPSAAEPLTRDQSRIAIGIIVGVLVLAFGFALWGLSQIPSLPGFEAEEPALVAPTPSPRDEAGGETTPDDGGEASGPSSGAELAFVGAVDFDPLGDGEERPEGLANILDGDSSTYWQTQGYQNATFSGLKPGVGVVLDLGESSTISSVTLDLPVAASGSLYVTDDDAFANERPAIRSDMEPAGTFSGAGSVTVDLAAGTSGRYVIVWFTETSRSGDWYRARLAGASATS